MSTLLLNYKLASQNTSNQVTGFLEGFHCQGNDSLLSLSSGIQKSLGSVIAAFCFPFPLFSNWGFLLRSSSFATIIICWVFWRW